ncbi:Golgi matrix protein 130 kD isoform X1 [Leptinotarsa decemlineata]|uniref:Golgi matrix protein 130 kD isoform X1 n=2 Tax=Leptinotarsa decemlineata TaxID=7539 RepID=UPI003D30BBEA
MADVSKAQKLKLANSRKRFKELQELKKKKDASQKQIADNISNQPAAIDSLTSSTHSSLNNEVSVEDTGVAFTTRTSLTNYFDNSNYGDNSMFFDTLAKGEVSEHGNQTSDNNIFNYFNAPQSPSSLETMVSNIVDTPKYTEDSFEPQFTESYALFPQETQHNYVAETQQILHPDQDNLSLDDPEIKENDLFEHHRKTENTEDFMNYQNGNKEEISASENAAIKNEIIFNSNTAQAEVKHSSVESLKQLSNQMAQLIEPEYAISNPITDLEKRNLELASLLEHERLNSEQQKAQLEELQARIVDLEMKMKEKEESTSLQTASEISRLREELQCHIQTVGLLVAEKTELSASLSQLELISKQKNSECEELQARLKASRSRAFELEQELNVLRAEKTKKENIGQEQIGIINQLRNFNSSLQEQMEEVAQDLLEVREKLKNSSEDNLQLQKLNQELSRKLSLAEITIQQITSGEQQHQVESQVQKLMQEKFELEKQLANLVLKMKTMTKEREESTTQYQQYTQELNTQLAGLSNQVQRLQQENEDLSVQEQNRIKHIGELERQLQSLQNEQIAFTVNRPNGESNLKNELDSTRELCIQLQIEKTSAEENFTKAVNEKDMLLKELTAKNDSLSQLESMVEQLRGNQPDSVKLLATMESDKVAAARAVQQNKELKEQMESMQEVFMKLDNDKVELTEKLNLELSSNKELLEKLQKTELQLQRLTDAIEIKDRELSHLRENTTELNRQILTQEQLSDRLSHCEVQDNLTQTLQQELRETKSTVIRLTNEMNILRNERKSDKVIDSMDKIDEGDLRKQLEELELKNHELELKLEDHSMFGKHFDENTDTLDKESAMRHLEEKVKHTMQKIADLTDEKQRLEHLVLQLQSETETIGEYVALYQRQRMMLKQKTVEKDQQLKQLDNDRKQMKTKLEKLNALIRRLVEEKGSVPTEILEQHKSLSDQSEHFCEEHTSIHNEIKNMNGSHQSNIEGSKSSETAEEIIALLSEIKTSNLVQPSENFHHCPWCSGQLITV